MVVSLGANNNEVNILMLNTATFIASDGANPSIAEVEESDTSASDAIFSPKFEQVIRQTAT